MWLIINQAVFIQVSDAVQIFPTCKYFCSPHLHCFLILVLFSSTDKEAKGKTSEAKGKDSKAADSKTTKTPSKSTSSAKDKKETGKSLWVSNLSSVTRAADLKTRFSQYGKVRWQNSGEKINVHIFLGVTVAID